MHQRKRVDVHVSGERPENSFTISMPRRDKERLEAFLRHYCILEQWVYTLAGVKPVTFSLCHTKFPFFDLISQRRKRFLGWNTWLKYQPYFQNSRFTVFPDKGWQSSDWMFITIIDRRQFNEVVRQYSDDFQSVLHLDSLDAERLLEREQGLSFFEDTLQGHDGLIGTVLGYGRNNAWQFFERSQGKEDMLESMWDGDLMSQMLDHWNKKPPFASWDLSHLFYPSCAADKNSEESIAFRKRYQEMRDTIIRYYEGRDFVEVTLSLLNRRLDDPSPLVERKML